MKWYSLVWLPTGALATYKEEVEQLSEEEASERNAKQAGQGIVNLRWRPVKKDADGNWVRA